MLVVAKKSRTVPEQGAEANTPEWRREVNAELNRRPRGARAQLARHLGISTGHLSEILGEDERPDVARWTRHKRQIDEFLWPPLLPPAQDTHEARYLIDALHSMDRDLLRALKDMDRDTQRLWAQVIIATRKPK